MNILLIRHGETDALNKGVVHPLHDPVPLSMRGREQMNLLIPLCLDLHVQYIISSPERRASESAHILTHGIKRGMEIMPELMDRNWGEWAGKSWEEIAKQFEPMDIDMRYHFIPPQGESWEQLDQRVDEGIKRIEHMGIENVAIISHIGIIRAMAPLLKGAPKETSLSYDLPHGSLALFEGYDEHKYRERVLTVG